MFNLVDNYLKTRMNVTSDIVPEVQPGVFTHNSYTILSNFESANLARVKYVCKQIPGVGAITIIKLFVL